MTDYTTGTITLTSGSTAFTTSGAALVSAAIRPGDAILRNGRFLVIASITGENQGTLAEACPADAAGTGVALRIRFQSDISRFSVKQAQLIASLSGGNAQSFAGLDGSGGNKGLHFTGAGAMATHPLTALARTFLGRGAAADMRNDIGANNAANLTTGTLPDARVSASLTPDKAFRRGNILGTVSQSGGVPTGALIEAGVNANGSYSRFADGRQICVTSVVIENHNITNTIGALFRSEAEVQLNFPASFLTSADLFISVTILQGTGVLLNVLSPGRPRFISATQFGIFLHSATSAAAVNLVIRGLSIGRWF